MDQLDINILMSLFNRGGYVLDFSTSAFDVFTSNSIGMALCEYYGLSKGKSLNAYYNDSDLNKQIILTKDLLNHYEAFCLNNEYEDIKYKKLYLKCVEILGKYQNGSIIDTTSIKRSTSVYMKGMIGFMDASLKQGDFDSVITKSRTLLEEVIIYGLETANMTVPRTGNISQLYREFGRIYDLHTNEGMDNRIQRLITGLESIISSFSEMRNNASDSHGIGKNRINLEKHHAEFYMNISTSMANFLLSIINNKFR